MKEPALDAIADTEPRYRGWVKFFESEKGYGFIKRDDGGRDVFLHKKNLPLELRTVIQEGHAVTFEIAETDKGPQAKNITRL